MAVQGQPTVYYTYDSGGLMNSVSMTHPVHGEQTFTFAYDLAGRRTGLTYPNGVETSYGYYPAGDIYSISVTNATAALETVRYTYDESGNRKSMARDGMEAGLPSAFANAPAYDSANRLTSFNSQSVLHDENGNITSWGNKSFVWDSRDRLVEVKESGNTIATFKYDALGRRVEKTVNSVTTRYLYDGLDIVMETDASGTPTVFYIRTLNIDEPLARIEISTGEIRYYHADALGSVIALTDENGTVKTRYNYSPFGDTETIGEASGNPFQYTGRENDGTGLYYYRARYYSSEIGRFISEDPIGLAGGDVNYFAYVKNQPCNAGDPLGLEPKGGERGATGGASGGRTNNPGKKCKELNPPDPEWVECKDHQTGKKIRVRRPPWMPFPRSSSEPKKSEMCDADCIDKVETVVITVGGAYIVYRCVRMIPSLFPPLWWTIPANAAIP